MGGLKGAALLRRNGIGLLGQETGTTPGRADCHHLAVGCGGRAGMVRPQALSSAEASRVLQAVVMAGGKGQRLRPLTLGRPKPLVPLFGRPLLGYLLSHLRERGIGEVFVTAGHLGEQIAGYLAALAPGFPVHCSIESCPRGTAGAVADLLPRLGSPFLVVSGDAVLDLDVAALRAVHERDGNLVTICLAPPSERLRFGTVALAGARVRGFVEKPPLAEVLPGVSINTGCYLLDRQALEGVGPADAGGSEDLGRRRAGGGEGRGESQGTAAAQGAGGDEATPWGASQTRAGGPLDFALDVFPELLRRGAPLGAVAAARYWRDIGTLEAYREAHFDGLTGRLPWALPEPLGHGRGDDQPEISPGARLEGTVHVGRGVRVETGARVVGPAVLGTGCRIGRGAEVSRSLLLDGCRVGAWAVVADSVVDVDSAVAPGAHVVGAGIGGRGARRRDGSLGQADARQTLRQRRAPAGRGTVAVVSAEPAASSTRGTLEGEGARAVMVGAQGDVALPEGAASPVAAAPVQ